MISRKQWNMLEVGDVLVLHNRYKGIIHRRISEVKINRHDLVSVAYITAPMLVTPKEERDYQYQDIAPKVIEVIKKTPFRKSSLTTDLSSRFSPKTRVRGL